MASSMPQEMDERAIEQSAAWAKESVKSRAQFSRSMLCVRTSLLTTRSHSFILPRCRTRTCRSFVEPRRRCRIPAPNAAQIPLLDAGGAAGRSAISLRTSATGWYTVTYLTVDSRNGKPRCGLQFKNGKLESSIYRERQDDSVDVSQTSHIHTPSRCVANGMR